MFLRPLIISSVCRNECLRFVSERLCSWEDEKLQVPLEELLSFTLENIRQISGETLLPTQDSD